MNGWSLAQFIEESNMIEGIIRDPTEDEIRVTRRFLSLEKVFVSDLEVLVGVYQPGARLRRFPLMDVRVGLHFPPRGGPEVEVELVSLLDQCEREPSSRIFSPFQVHCLYELLHPFTDGNGRTGRALWLWMMGRHYIPSLGFLHTFYYQSLDVWRTD